jgi:hypothetical protein
MNTSRMLVAVGAVTLMTYGSALAQQQAPAQPPTAPPSPTSPAIPPAAPAVPSASASAQAGAQTMTATGELVKVDAKEESLTVKTATGEVTIKYDNETKVSGASRNTAGLATMSGSQVTIRYKKDGASNVATSIEVKPATGASPGLSEPRPSPGGDRPLPPGGDPSKPPTPRP